MNGILRGAASCLLEGGSTYIYLQWTMWMRERGSYLLRALRAQNAHQPGKTITRAIVIARMALVDAVCTGWPRLILAIAECIRRAGRKDESSSDSEEKFWDDNFGASEISWVQVCIYANLGGAA